MYELLVARGFTWYQWHSIEHLLNAKTLLEITGLFSEIRITFKHSITGEEKEYRGSSPLTDLPDTRKTDTLATWLTRWGNRQLMGMDAVTDWQKLNKTIYCNAETSGYQILVGNEQTHPSNLKNRTGNYEDVVLYRDNLDANKFVDNVLVVVNGLIYPSTAQDDYICVKGAHQCIKHDKHVDVGLWSFESVGGFSIIHLGDKFDPVNDISEGRRDITFNIGNLLNDEFFYLIIEGRIFLQETLVRWIDEDRMRLKLRNFDLISGHAEDYRRLKKDGENNPSWGGDLLSSEGIAKLFQHPNTFLIKFNRKAPLYVDYTALTPTGTAGKYMHMGPVDDPIMRPDNRMVGGYITHNGDPKIPHIVSVTSAEMPHMFENTGVDVTNTLIKGTVTPYDSPRSSSLFLSRVYSLEDKSGNQGVTL